MVPNDRSTNGAKMDLSLDDVVIKTTKGRGRGRSIGQRLGPKNFAKGNFQRQVGNRTQGPNPTTFKVTGLGKVKNVQGNFDARQKLVQKIPDARQKIVQKTKFADARTRIESKKPVDARSRIESAKAKKVDAREKITARQGTANGSTGPQIRVTGLGNTRSPVKVASSGGLTKTIRVNESSGTTITTPQLLRTINNEQAMEQKVPVHITRTAPLRKTVQNVVQQRQGPTLTLTTKRRAPAPASGMLRTQYAKPQPQFEAHRVSIQNNYYEEPEPEPEPEPQPKLRIMTRPAQPVSSGVMARLSAPVAVTQITTADEMSPLQGFRVMVTNLHPVVTQEDVVELFGAVGALKRARLIKLGTAEVVFVKKEEALSAVRKYHMRELDGQPMQVVLTTPIAPEPSVAAPPKPKPTPVSTGPLRLAGSQAAEASRPADVTLDPNLIHKALFRTSTRDDPPSRPVTFTVKI